MLVSSVFWDRVIPSLNEGLLFSLSLIVPSAILGFIGGVLLGSIRVFAPRFLVGVANFYVSVIRGIPLLLQLFFLYYALPGWGIRFSSYEAALIGFIMCSAAYHSEYIRGALLSIRSGQVKAAMALGFSNVQMVRTILIPQAIRYGLPGCGNEIIYLIKYSSLAYVITFIELTGHAKEEAARSFNYIEVYLAAGFYYLILTTIATYLLHLAEKRMHIPGFLGKK